MQHFNYLSLKDMKKIYYLFTALLVLIGFGSCKKFLDTKPSDFVDPNVYYVTAEQLNFAMAGVYNTLGTAGAYGSYIQYMLGFVGDEGHMNRNTLIGPHGYNYVTNNSFLTAYWTTFYDGINRANVLLANIDNNTSLDQNVRNQIRGEVLFLRGFFYFQLVQYFGGVPLKLAPTSTIVDVNIPRASVKEVYDQILKDMTEAEPLVPGIKTLGYGGRVSKSAVRGLLARVCLNMAGSPLNDISKYADAKMWASKVIEDTEAAHTLNPSYPDIFIKLASDKYDTNESIWEVEFSGNLMDDYSETGNQGYINAPQVAAGSPNGVAVAYMRTNAKLYNVFEPGDNRKWWSIAHFTYAATGAIGTKTMNVPIPTTEAAKYSLFPAKFRREYEVIIPKGTASTPQNVPILRFADVLLMYAEAENEINGPTPDAVNKINDIRRRGWSTGIKTITVTNGGSGYTTAPAVTFAGGSNAAAVATISGGKVTAITLSRDLTGTTFNQEGKYTSVPAITIGGGGGTGATATATINSLSDADVKPADKASKEALRAFIRDERMRELNFEVSRKSDLHRWGIFTQTMQDVGSNFRQDVQTPAGVIFSQYFLDGAQPRNVFWPIPEVETSLNHAIIQNLGWN
jgi:hypothetical protein